MRQAVSVKRDVIDASVALKWRLRDGDYQFAAIPVQAADLHEAAPEGTIMDEENQP